MTTVPRSTGSDAAAPAIAELLEVGLWRALESHHAHLAESHGSARHYRADIARFAAFDPSLASVDEGAWADLGRLIGPGGFAFLTTVDPALVAPDGWSVVFEDRGHQMVLTEPGQLHVDAPGVRPAHDVVHELTDADVPAMRALVVATKPGPFFDRTIEMGRYVGVFDGDRLVAMAGERIHPPGFTEVSAVCTTPEARGRGLATALVRVVAEGIIARGETPFLNVRAGNPARSLYEQLGFTVQRTFTFRSVRVD